MLIAASKSRIFFIGGSFSRSARITTRKQFSKTELPMTSAAHITNGFVDAHAHLIHEQFSGEEDAIAEKCRAFGLDYVIVNGLEPVSNRAVIDLCERHDGLVPALGIYPIDAACNVISAEHWKHHFPPPNK
jgi:hypothetical protein